MTGVHRDTIGRFAFAMGEGCARLHDRIVRDLACALVDMDEQHSWCTKRQQNIPDDAPDTGPVDVTVNYTNCVQCGAITAKGGRLTPPEGGDGPLYQIT